MLKEKSKADKIEILIRWSAYAVVLLYVIFRIGVPVVKGDPIYLDKNDGYVMGGSLALALVMESVKAYLKKKTEK